MQNLLDDCIVGHEKQRLLLRQLLLADKFPHALLLSGKPGIGKRLIALEISKTILTRSLTENDSLGKEKALKLIRHGEHPDLYFLLPRENRKTIGIEEIRELQERLSLTPYYRTGACIIIEDAEKMSIQASNCLLKTLEEPIENRYFLLISSSPHLIPPTIISRTQKMLLGTLTRREVESIINKFTNNISALGDINDLLSILDGSMELLSLSPINRFQSTTPKEEEIEKALNRAKMIHDLSVKFSHLYEHLGDTKRFISEATHVITNLEKESDFSNFQILLALTTYLRSSLKKGSIRSNRLNIADHLIALAKSWEEIKSRNLNLNLQLNNNIINH